MHPWLLRSLTHLLTHLLSHLHTHLLSYLFTRSFIQSVTTQLFHSLNCSLTQSSTHSHTHSLTLINSLFHRILDIEQWITLGCVLSMDTVPDTRNHKYHPPFSHKSGQSNPSPPSTELFTHYSKLVTITVLCLNRSFF
jgi:hypothetical protein